MGVLNGNKPFKNLLKGIFMNKSEFIKAIADKAGMTQKDVTAACDAMLDVVTETLKAGDKIQLVGVGTLELKKVDEKTGINPRTKETVKIPASNKPVLKFGSAYKAKFN